MPKGFDNSNANEGFKSPLTTTASGKKETWPAIANVAKHKARDPLGIVPRIPTGHKGKEKE